MKNILEDLKRKGDSERIYFDYIGMRTWPESVSEISVLMKTGPIKGGLPVQPPRPVKTFKIVDENMGAIWSYKIPISERCHD